MRLLAAIVAFALAAGGLLWAALYCVVIVVFLVGRIGGVWRFALGELSREIDLQRLAVAACALILGVGFLLMGTALVRGKPPA